MEHFSFWGVAISFCQSPWKAEPLCKLDDRFYLLSLQILKDLGDLGLFISGFGSGSSGLNRLQLGHVLKDFHLKGPHPKGKIHAKNNITSQYILGISFFFWNIKSFDNTEQIENFHFSVFFFPLTFSSFFFSYHLSSNIREKKGEKSRKEKGMLLKNLRNQVWKNKFLLITTLQNHLKKQNLLPL